MHKTGWTVIPNFSVSPCYKNIHPNLWPKDSAVIYHWNIVAVQSLSHVRLFFTPLTAAHQAYLSSTISQSLLKLMSTESVMPSNHRTLCRPLFLPPSIFPSIRDFPNESAVHIR